MRRGLVLSELNCERDLISSILEVCCCFLVEDKMKKMEGKEAMSYKAAAKI